MTMLIDEIRAYLDATSALIAERRHTDLKQLNPMVDAIGEKLRTLSDEDSKLWDDSLDDLIHQLRGVQSEMQAAQQDLITEAKRNQHMQRSLHRYHHAAHVGDK